MPDDAEEVWRPVRIRPDRYEVSNLGRVRSRKEDGATNLLTPRANWQGYQRVRLRVEGKSKLYSVHRLVGAAFWGFDSLVVKHEDDDPGNNQLANLTPGTQSDNIADAVARGRHANARKTHCKHDHEFTAENTYWDKNGYRSCRTCRASVAETLRLTRLRKRETMETLNVLPDTEFLGLVRTRDPETSWTAAEKQTSTKSATLRGHVLWILKESGPLTDDQIVARYNVLVTEHPMFYNWATPQSIRTHRKELVDGRRGVDKSITDTGVKRDSANGGPSTVWAAL